MIWSRHRAHSVLFSIVIVICIMGRRPELPTKYIVIVIVTCFLLLFPTLKLNFSVIPVWIIERKLLILASYAKTFIFDTNLKEIHSFKVVKYLTTHFGSFRIFPLLAGGVTS